MRRAVYNYTEMVNSCAKQRDFFMAEIRELEKYLREQQKMMYLTEEEAAAQEEEADGDATLSEKVVKWLNSFG